jgi:hypothetical protein
MIRIVSNPVGYSHRAQPAGGSLIRRNEILFCLLNDRHQIIVRKREIAEVRFALRFGARAARRNADASEKLKKPNRRRRQKPQCAAI